MGTDLAEIGMGVGVPRALGYPAGLGLPPMDDGFDVVHHRLKDSRRTVVSNQLGARTDLR